MLLCALVLSPLLYLIAAIFFIESPAWDHLRGYLFTGYLVGTLKLSLGTILFSLLFAVVPAWLSTAFSFPAQKFLSWALALPLAIPTYIAAIAWASVFDFSGPYPQILRGLGLDNTNEFTPDIMNIYGACFVLSSVLYPYIYVICRGVLRQRPQVLIESARSLGASPQKIFFKVIIPLLRPAIIGGTSLILMETLNDYGAIHYYGVDTLTTGIFRAWLGLGDLGAAIRLALGLLLMVTLFLALERYLRRDFQNKSHHHRPYTPYKLTGIKAWTATTLCFIPPLLGFLVPVSMLVYWALQIGASAWTVSLLSLGLRSLYLALGTSALLCFTAIILTYCIHLFSKDKFSVLLRSASLGYAVPGAVIAIGVFALVNQLDRTLWAYSSLTLALSGSSLALVWAYLVRFSGVALNAVSAGFEKQGPKLDEAAKALGIGPFQSLIKVHLPLLKGPTLAAFTLSFIDILKELPLTLILRPFDFETLATQTYALAAEELVPESAPSALLLITFGLLAVWLSQREHQKNGGSA